MDVQSSENTLNNVEPKTQSQKRLRKHIATVTRVLSLKTNEIERLAKFMGRTSNTHETFYKLPQDVYQVAKVSKILQLMEKGDVAQFKNKSLEEIDIDMENIEEDLDIEEGDLETDLKDHHRETFINDVTNSNSFKYSEISDFNNTVEYNEFFYPNSGNESDSPNTSECLLKTKSEKKRW